MVVFDSYSYTEKRKDDLFRQSECEHLGLNGGRLIGPYRPRVFFADSIESRDPKHSFCDPEEAEAYWYPYFEQVALSDAICDIGDVTKLIDNVTKLIQNVHITSATTCANVPKGVRTLFYKKLRMLSKSRNILIEKKLISILKDAEVKSPPKSVY